MTEPVNLGPDVPTVSLGGKNWPVPFLSLGRNRKLQPLFGRVTKTVFSPTTQIADITESDMADLVEIAFLGLSQAHPGLTRDELEDLPIGVYELITATNTIMMQSKLFRAPKPGEDQGPPSP